MKKSVLKGIVSYLLIMLSVCNHIKGQQVSVFQSLTTKDGLPSNYVFDISEDENGFLWMGTDKGLARYDGFRWQVLNMENGLPGNYINKALCNGKDALWLVIATKGLYHYKISTGQLTFITKDYLIYEFQLNENGDLFFYNNFISDTPRTAIGFYVKAQYPYPVAKIFSFNMADSNFSFSIDFKKQILQLIPWRKSSPGTAPLLNNYSGWKTEITDFAIADISLLKRINDGFYVSLENAYYTRSDVAIKKIAVYKKLNGYLNTAPCNKGYWLWNEKDGLYYADEKGKLTHYTEADGLSNPMVTNVLQTKNGNFLISTLGGGLNYKLPAGNAMLNTNSKPVRGLAQSANTIFATVDDKLLKFDITQPGKTSSFTLPDKSIQGIDVWGNDIFISSLYGFSVYTSNENGLAKKDQQGIGAGISSVIRSGNNWYAGSFGTNVWIYDNAARTIVRDSTTPLVSEKLQPLSRGYTSYNYEDGVQFIYPEEKITLTTKDGLPANAVYNLHEYKDTVWISTAKGVAAYTNGKVVKTFTAANGLKGNKCIFSFHDNKGNYWVLTDKYLNVFNGTKFNTLTSIAVSDGIDDMAYSYLYNSNTNTLVIGSLKKIFLTRLDNIESESAAIPPLLSAVYTDGNSMSGKRSFTLSSDYKTVSFSFKPVEANPFAKSFIYYRLDGLHNAYIELKDSLTIGFPKLRAGSYRLFAKTINADGVESKERLLSEFSVAVPFWQKGWFVALGILTAALGLFSLSYLVRKRKNQKIAAAYLLEESLIKERERISKDLHDHLGTSLVTMIAQTDNIESKLLNKQISEALEKIQQLSDQSRETVNILRETIWAVQENSHSLDEFILRTRSFLQRVLPQKNIEWHLAVNGRLENKLTANQSLQLFRIIQEATQNIIKHSEATIAAYHINAASNNLEIKITDNGKGFDPATHNPGNGLKNIKQRTGDVAGNCHITSMEGKGTTITLNVPLTSTAKN